MSNRTSDNLSREKIQKLLSAVGTKPAPDDSQIEAKELNWCEPHYFSNEQLQKITLFTEKLAQALAKKFTDFCRSRFEVTIGSTTQHFANDFFSQSAKDGGNIFYLSLSAEQNQPFGLLGIPGPTAILWTKQLLGDSDSEDGSERELSRLEKSLLFDLACALVQALSQVYSVDQIRPASSFAGTQRPSDFDGTEELCRISYNVKRAETDNSAAAYFLIPCRKLEPVVGISREAAAKPSKENTADMILQHLGYTPVRVTVQLAGVELSFEEMMDLQVNDIVILDKKVDEPVELIVEGRTVCYGWPVKSAGNYAFTVSETVFGDTN
jgi:flagellar motor switch protein FliM